MTVCPGMTLAVGRDVDNHTLTDLTQQRTFYLLSFFRSLFSSLLSFFLSPDIHELRGSMMSICFIAVVKQLWATLVLGWVTGSVHYSSLRWLCGSYYYTKIPIANYIYLFIAANKLPQTKNIHIIY